jgi:hypothetical protein
MYTRWGNTGKMWGTSGVMESPEVLLEWMEADPVDTWEMGRNDAVQQITGTRNVFVDYPEYAWLLLGEKIPQNMSTPSGGKSTSTNPPVDSSSSSSSSSGDSVDCAHTFGEWETIKEPTTTAVGLQERECSKCGETETKTLPKLSDGTTDSSGSNIGGSEFDDPNKDSVWYCSKHYRVNLYSDQGKLRIRDLHIFKEDYPDPFEDKVCPNNEATYDALPVVDGNVFSGNKIIAGAYPVDAKTGEAILSTDMRFTQTGENTALVDYGSIRFTLMEQRGEFVVRDIIEACCKADGAGTCRCNAAVLMYNCAGNRPARFFKLSPHFQVRFYLIGRKLFLRCKTASANTQKLTNCVKGLGCCRCDFVEL